MIPPKLLAAYPFLRDIDIYQADVIDFAVFCRPPRNVVESLRSFDQRFSCCSLVYGREREARSKPGAQFCRIYSSASLDLEGLFRLHQLQKQLPSDQIVVAYSWPLRHHVQ